MSINEYSEKKCLLARKLDADIRKLKTELLCDYAMNEYKARLDIGVAELINEYKVAYQQADIMEKKEIKQTKIKIMERHISNR